MKEEIETVFNALQELDMKPTPHNVSIMNGVYELLRGLYKETEDEKGDGGKDGSPSDHGG